MTFPPSINRHLVLTLLGPDQPGIVAIVAAIIAEHGGNWMQSRMVRLGGQFAGLVQAAVPADHFDALCAAMEKLREQDLRVTVEESETTPEAETPTRKGQLELVVPDRPGILREITQVLAARAVNVEELVTEFVAAPWSGELLFKAEISVRAPADLTPADLRADLEAAAPDLMLDLNFSVES